MPLYLVLPTELSKSGQLDTRLMNKGKESALRAACL